MEKTEKRSLISGSINRSSKLPLHQQLYELLREKIRSGEWKEGQMIPPEPDLISQYGVSRIVVRQVLNRLVGEGLLFRQQGRGSFVAKRRLEEGLSRIISFTEDMKQRGLTPKTRVITKDFIFANENIAEKLDIQPGEELVHLERLRLADEEPLSIEDSYLVHSFFPGILEEDFTLVPLRQTLQNKYGVRITHAKQVIRSVLCTSEQAKLLAISEKTPLLMIERVSYSDQDQRIEFLRIFYRGERYCLFNELQD